MMVKMPTKLRIIRAIKKAAALRSFEQRGDAWYSIKIETNSGMGQYDREDALRQHNRLIGFDTLAALGFDDDETHQADWHTWPQATPEEFVIAALAHWKEVLEAREAVAPIHALIKAVCGHIN